MLRIRSFGITDRGRKRPHNEDAFMADDALGLFAVADGVGGNAKGEVASAEAVDQIRNFIGQAREAIARAHEQAPNGGRVEELRRLLEGAVQSACYVVFGMAQQDPSQKGMSTTISALLITGPIGFIAQVGDSRIYRVRAGKGAQLTEDHTLVNYKLKRGEINADQARTMKGKNVITRAVGHKDYVEVDTGVVDVEAGDRYLLCSDGLHGYLQDGEVEAVLAGGALEESPGRFVTLANGRGGKDNITAVVVAVA